MLSASRRRHVERIDEALAWAGDDDVLRSESRGRAGARVDGFLPPRSFFLH
jgi:hypothetical protein